MENLGSLALLLAFCVAIYAAFASVVGRLRRKPFLVVSGERAVYSVWALVALASGILVYSLMTGDFRFAYVAEHSNRTMPVLYKFAAWWGGQEGSLLFWSFLLSTYSSVVVFTNRRKHRDMMPYVTAILMTVAAFFLVLNNFIANPFQMLAQDKLIVNVGDGNGLSPLLQYPAMAGSTPPAAGPWSPGSSKVAASCSAPPGPITSSAGADTGAGTRSKTPRSFPGSAEPPSCTRS